MFHFTNLCDAGQNSHKPIHNARRAHEGGNEEGEEEAAGAAEEDKEEPAEGEAEQAQPDLQPQRWCLNKN